jgi:MGT family glycosyltransferase
MARLAFFNLPAYGHVNATLPVVAELVRQGESVVYYNSEEFRRAIERTGAEFRSYHPPVDEDAGQTAANFLRLTAVLLETSLDLLPGLLESIEKDPVDYVIHDSVCPWGSFVAKVLNLPAISSNSLFALTRQLFLPENRLARAWSIPAALIKDLPSLRRIRRQRRYLESVYGITKTRIFDVLSNRAPLNVVYTSREFQPRAGLFDDTYRFVGPSVAPRGDEEGWAHELGDDPVIYVALGTIFNDCLPFYRTCLEALAGMKHRVVMSVGRKIDITQLGAIPSNFLVRNWVPQLLVLSKASLFLTRSGINSANEALYYGVPMLLFPEILEQKLVAGQVVAAGAGLILDEHTLRADDLRRQVNQALGEPGFQQAAQRIGSSLRNAGGYRRAAEEILQFRGRQLAASGASHRSRSGAADETSL